MLGKEGFTQSFKLPEYRDMPTKLTITLPYWLVKQLEAESKKSRTPKSKKIRDLLIADWAKKLE